MTVPDSFLRRRSMLAALPTWLGVVTAHADSDPLPPMRVTTDSPEYCTWLAEELRRERRARGPATLPEKVRLLSVEGRRMCDEGHLRPGIMRLRKALQILRGEP